MRRRELVKAADELLGPDYKLRPLRKKRISNPDYKIKRVDWKLRVDGNAGALEITIGKNSCKSTITLPCKIFTEDLFGECKIVEIPKEFYFMINGDFIDYVCKSVSQILSKEKNGTSFLEGTMLIPPYILKIPKEITVEVLSLEGLQEEGLLPMDLEQQGV